MQRRFLAFLIALVLSIAFSGYAMAFGEDVLAATGQYTFFIKPYPGCPLTYYQKMVPCKMKQTVFRSNPIVERYPVPVPKRGGRPVIVTETPAGWSDCDSCIECFPKPLQYRGRGEALLSRNVPIPVTFDMITPKTVERRVRRPQWFAVEEKPIPSKRRRGQMGPTKVSRAGAAMCR